MTREEAINELKYELDYMLEGTGIKGREKEEAERNEDFKKVYQANMMAIEALEEQKTAKCINMGFSRKWWSYTFKCSNCGDVFPGKRNYCWSCGAKMEVENADNN